MNVIFPNNKEEWFAKGNFVDALGNTVIFEMPAVFDSTGNIDQTATYDKINEFINSRNISIEKQNQKR